jgi:tetratricopeptide (TPR) repeat protein
VQKSLAERAESNLNLAMLYQASGRSDEVEGLLRTALKRDPGFYPALVTLVQWLEANGRRQEAQALLAQSLKEHPDAALLQHTRACRWCAPASPPGHAIPAQSRATGTQSAQFGYAGRGAARQRQNR